MLVGALDQTDGLAVGVDEQRGGVRLATTAECTDLAAHPAISLTSVDRRGAEMGQRAVAMLLERVGGRSEPQHHVVTAALVVRDSSGPLRSKPERPVCPSRRVPFDKARREHQSPVGVPGAVLVEKEFCCGRAQVVATDMH